MSKYVLDKLNKGEHVLCITSIYQIDPVKTDNFDGAIVVEIVSYSHNMYWDSSGCGHPVVVPIQVIEE